METTMSNNKTIKTYSTKAMQPPPVKMERILYIGVGGTGARALLKTKERYLKTYGFIHNSVKFLLIDTDAPPRITGAVPLLFDDHEYLLIHIYDPMAVINNVCSIAEFWPKGVLADPIIDGCGQRRGNGYLALHFRAPEVFDKIEAILEELQSPNLASSHPEVYEIPPTNSVRVCLVASDCGGTGSGMALNIARYIREAIFEGNPGHQLLGFFISHTAFEKKPHTDLIESNKYAFWKELDFLATTDPRRVPKTTLHGTTLPRADRKGVSSLLPFNKIFVLDAKNDLFSYQLEDIEDSLSRVLFLASGYLAGSAISIWRNTAVMPWYGKQPILSGIGESEIVYHAAEISEYAAVSLVKRLVNTVLMQEETYEATGTEVLTMLNSWELVEAEKNQLIERILDPHEINHIRTPARYDKETANDLLAVEQKNRARTIENLRKTALTKSAAAKTKSLDDLRNYVHLFSNRPGGLFYLEQFLRQCHEFFVLYREMMIEKNNELVKAKDERVTAIDKTRRQVTEAANRFFSRRNNLKKAYENLAGATRSYLITEVEILRREQAADVYKELLQEVRRLLSQVKTLQNTCELTLNKSITQIQAALSRRRQKRSNEITVGEELAEQIIKTADVSGYLLKFSETPSFLNLSQRNVDELYEEFCLYCRSLPSVQVLHNETLENVLAKMDREDLKNLLTEMDRFSQPLWQWDLSYRNVDEGRKTENIFLIGCGSASDNIFTELELIQYLPSKGAAKPAIIGTGDYNRIVCIRIEDSIPPFALKSLAACKNKYERAKRESITMRDRGLNRIAYEIDGRLEDSLPDLFPSQEKDEDIQVWALAHVPGVFNLITKNGTYYYAHSRKDGRPTDDFKVRLAQGRVAAFNNYMKDENLIHEHQQLITQCGKKMGDADLATQLREYVENVLMEQARSNTEMELKQLVEKEIVAINDFIIQLSKF